MAKCVEYVQCNYWADGVYESMCVHVGTSLTAELPAAPCTYGRSADQETESGVGGIHTGGRRS